MHYSSTYISTFCKHEIRFSSVPSLVHKGDVVPSLLYSTITSKNAIHYKSTGGRNRTELATSY